MYNIKINILWHVYNSEHLLIKKGKKKKQFCKFLLSDVLNQTASLEYIQTDLLIFFILYMWCIKKK